MKKPLTFTVRGFSVLINYKIYHEFGISQRKYRNLTWLLDRYDMIMNNTTHYNLIDTFNHVMGREKFSAMYHEFVKDFLKPMQAKSWNGSMNMQDVAAVYSDAKDMPFPVACTFAGCFMRINETDLHKGGGDGYGIDA